jgi:hypothetical protein
MPFSILPSLYKTMFTNGNAIATPKNIIATHQNTLATTKISLAIPPLCLAKAKNAKNIAKIIKSM